MHAAFTTLFSTTNLLVISMLGLSLAVIADQSQLLAKYFGAKRSRIATGYNLAMKIMVVNRMGAVLYFILVAFSIDSGAEPRVLVILILGTLLLLAAFNLAMSVWFQRKELAGPLVDLVPLRSEVPVIFASVLATTFNILGLTAPFILGATFPEYRLTLANTSFLFNTTFTIINVFYIESLLAGLADSNSPRMAHFVLFILSTRIIAVCLALLILLVVFL